MSVLVPVHGGGGSCPPSTLTSERTRVCVRVSTHGLEPPSWVSTSHWYPEGRDVGPVVGLPSGVRSTVPGRQIPCLYFLWAPPASREGEESVHPDPTSSVVETEVPFRSSTLLDTRTVPRHRSPGDTRDRGPVYGTTRRRPRSSDAHRYYVSRHCTCDELTGR